MAIVVVVVAIVFSLQSTGFSVVSHANAQGMDSHNFAVLEDYDVMLWLNATLDHPTDVVSVNPVDPAVARSFSPVLGQASPIAFHNE